MDENKTENWTSVDMYYKGFHIKKSFGENVNRVTIIKEINDLIDAGFQPSWNPDTNKASVVTPTAQTAPQATQVPQTDDVSAICPIHNVTMTQREGQYGTFWSHSTGKDANGKTVWCNGRKAKYNGYQK